MSNNALTSLRRYWPDLTAVKDGREPLEIEVTREDVRKSTMRDPHHCAFAQACRRSKGVDDALVSPNVTWLKVGHVGIRYESTGLRDPLRKSVKEFDKAGAFQPGVYKLKPTSPKRRLGARQQKGYGKHTKPPFTGQRKHRVNLRPSVNSRNFYPWKV